MPLASKGGGIKSDNHVVPVQWIAKPPFSIPAQDNSKMHICANFVILAQSHYKGKFPSNLSLIGQNDLESQSQWPIFSIQAEIIPGCMFGANWWFQLKSVMSCHVDNRDVMIHWNIVSWGVLIYLSYHELVYRYKQYYAIARKNSMTHSWPLFYSFFRHIFAYVGFQNVTLFHHKWNLFDTCCMNTVRHFASSRSYGCFEESRVSYICQSQVHGRNDKISHITFCEIKSAIYLQMKSLMALTWFHLFSV